MYILHVINIAFYCVFPYQDKRAKLSQNANASNSLHQFSGFHYAVVEVA